MHNGVTPESERLIHSYSSGKAVPMSEKMTEEQTCNCCLGSKSMTTLTLEDRLEEWIFAECNEPKPQTRQRFRELNKIFRDIYADPRFWQYQNHENYDYYGEALSRMWRYFWLNLCQATTARKSGSFLKTRTYAVGRLLINLQGHLKNIQTAINANRPVQPRPDDDGKLIDPIEVLPNPEPDLAVQQYEAFLYLLETDPTGELTAEENTLCGKDGAYTLTAQKYLLMRYQDDMTIHQIADQLGIPRGTVQGRGKPTKWKEIEHKLAQMAIDSVSD